MFIRYCLLSLCVFLLSSCSAKNIQDRSILYDPLLFKNQKDAVQMLGEPCKKINYTPPVKPDFCGLQKECRKVASLWMWNDAAIAFDSNANIISYLAQHKHETCAGNRPWWGRDAYR